MFLGRVAADGSWVLDPEGAIEVLDRLAASNRPALIMGTAFLFVHLLDYMAARQRRLRLPPGSRALETGGYKGRSRSLSRAELHGQIKDRLGLEGTGVLREYGMAELSSQAYAVGGAGAFRIPPWARAQVVSPETGCEVAVGETGLIRVTDLANVFSVLSVQTEDLAVRVGNGFELIGSAAEAEPRGCALNSNDAWPS